MNELRKQLDELNKRGSVLEWTVKSYDAWPTISAQLKQADVLAEAVEPLYCDHYHSWKKPLLDALKAYKDGE